MVTFGQILRKKRESKGWTIRKLGKKLGVSPTTISNWELGNSLPNIYTALDIATLFGCSIDALVKG